MTAAAEDTPGTEEWWNRFGVGELDPITGAFQDYRVPPEEMRRLEELYPPPPAPELDWPPPGKVQARYSAKNGSPYLVIGGQPIYSKYEVKASGFHGYDVHAVVELSRETGRLEITLLSVRQIDGGASITGKGLRDIPLQTFVRRAFQLTEPAVDGDGYGYGLMSTADRDRLREAGPVTETLEMVARFYTVAYVIGESPTKTVQQAFDIPRPTADGWIRKARDRGFIKVGA